MPMPPNYANFPTDPQLMPICMAYRNQEYVADLVFPRTPPISSPTFDYFKLNREDLWRHVETEVSAESIPNKVTMKGTKVTGSVRKDYLQQFVSMWDQNVTQRVNPLGLATETLMDRVLLAREKRVADLTFNSTTYASGNTTSLTGSDRWDDSTSNPVDAILDVQSSLVYPANTLVIGYKAWMKLKRHPKVVAAVKGVLNPDGVVTPNDIKEIFELQNIIIGKTFQNTAVQGKDEVLTRLWGNHCALLYINPKTPTFNLQSLNMDVTFGITVQMGTREVRTIPNGIAGGEGGYDVVAGEKVSEHIIANDLGYLFQNVIS